MDFTLPTDNNFHPQLTENSSPLQFTEESSGGQCNLLHPAEMEALTSYSNAKGVLVNQNSSEVEVAKTYSVK